LYFAANDLLRMRLALFLLALTSYGILAAQIPCSSERYRKQVFSQVTLTSDIKYGEADNFLGISQDLLLDFYEPGGDTLTERPLVIWFFGGGFEIGDKTDTDMATWCDSLTRYGFTTASVNYRLGLVPTTSGGERAIYRALQDGRAAIRFLKEFATTFRIDTNRIYVAGNSAGAIIALHLPFADKESERPASTYSSLLLDDLGCLDCSGNTYSHTVEPAGIISLWGAVGDTAWMEPGDQNPILMIHGTDDNTIPFIEGPPYGWPGFPPVYGSLRISQRALQLGIYHELHPYFGEGHAFYGYGTILQTFPNANWIPVFHQARDFLIHIQEFTTAPITGSDTVCEGSVRNYSTDFHPGSTYCWEINGGIIISPNQQGHQVLVEWPAAGTGTLAVTETNKVLMRGDKSPVKPVQIRNEPISDFQYIQVGNLVVVVDQSQYADLHITDFGDGTTTSSFNPNHSYADTGNFVITYYAASPCGIDTSWQTVYIDANTLANDPMFPASGLRLFPNPVASGGQLFWDPGTLHIRNISLIDLAGRTILADKGIEVSPTGIRLPSLNPGIYFLQIHTSGGTSSHKILIAN
jgi:acetyl esterase/lipase/PKD repeat protein